MAEASEHHESIRIAHLTLLQSVVTRMGANSFTLKALAATFGSAGVAIMATMQNPSPYYPVAAVIPIVIFWLMDAQYLRLERGYRHMFDQVRRGEEIEPYSLDAEPFMVEIAPVLRMAVTWSVAWFYLAIFFSFGAVALLILCGDLNGWCLGNSSETGCEA